MENEERSGRDTAVPSASDLGSSYSLRGDIMKKLFAIIVVFLFLSPAFAQSANDLFQQALVMERSEGNLREAISLYERVVAGSDRTLAAKALIRIGENYERLGLRQARQAYQRVLDDFSEQQDVARIARDRLSSLLAAMAEAEPQPLSNSIVTRHVMDIPDNMGKVSPDGRFLSFVEWNSANVGILNLETGEQTLVNSDGYWSDNSSAFGDVSIWSPDGKELMYLWLSDEGSEIRIYNTETGGTRILIPPGSKEVPFPIKWTHDGNHLLAINERDGHITDAITLVDTKSASTRVVTTLSENWHTFGMDMSPDEKHIVYESFMSGARQDGNAPVALNILSVDGSSQVTLVDNGLRNYSPAWDKEGKHVLYMSLRDGDTELWALGVENGQATGRPRLVYSGFEGTAWPAGIADDGRYFYSQATRENYVYEQGVDFSTGEMLQNLRVISSVRLGSQRSGAVSPSGEYLAFVSEKPGEALLVITHQVSGDTRVHDFTEFGRIQLPPSQALRWSSDNSSVLVEAVDQNVQPVRPVFLSVDAKDGSFVKLSGFEDFGVGSPGALKGKGYSADGKKVVFAATRHLVEMDIGNKSQRVIHEYADREIVAMSVSPDGKTAAVSVGPGNSSNSDRSTIELVSLVDGSVSKLEEVKNEMGYSRLVGIAWTPDGKNLVFAENRPNSGQQLYSVNVASGKRIAIGEPIFGDDQFSGVRVHPDGDKLTFSKGSGKIQLWVLEGIEL